LHAVVGDKGKKQGVGLAFGGGSVVGTTLNHPTIALYRMPAKIFPQGPIDDLGGYANRTEQQCKEQERAAVPPERVKISHEVWANPDQLTTRFSQRSLLQTMASRSAGIMGRLMTVMTGTTAETGACYNFGHFLVLLSAGSTHLLRVPALWL